MSYSVKKLILTTLILWQITHKLEASVNLSVAHHRDLVSKLIKNETFEKLALNISSSFLAFTFHQESLSEKQQQYEKNLLDSYKERQYLTLPEKQEIASILGFATWEQYAEKTEYLSKLKTQLNQEFPELRILNLEEAKEVIASAFYKLDIAKKLADKKALQECLDAAATKSAFCMSKRGWYYNLSDKLMEACIGSAIIVVFTGYLFAEIFTDFAATPFVTASWNTFILAANLICVTVTAAAFGIERKMLLNNKEACEKTLSEDNAACIAKYK